MEAVKFTEEYLEKVFDESAIEDDDLFDCLKGREGTFEETNESFGNVKEDHMVLNIKLKMIDL